LNVLDPLQPLPAIPIKDEPIDTDDDYQMKSIDESDDMAATTTTTTSTSTSTRLGLLN